MEKILTRSRRNLKKKISYKNIYIYTYLLYTSLFIYSREKLNDCSRRFSPFFFFFFGEVTRIDRWTLEGWRKRHGGKKSSLARKRWKRNLDEGKIKWMDACATIVIKLSQRSVVINRLVGRPPPKSIGTCLQAISSRGVKPMCLNGVCMCYNNHLLPPLRNI